MQDVLFAVGAGFVGGGIPLAALTALLATSHVGQKNAVQRFRDIRYVDVTERQLPVPDSIHVWVTNLEALHFRRLGEVQMATRKWVLRLYLGPDGGTIGYVSDKPRSLGFDTQFADGAAMETFLCGTNAPFRSRDLQITQARGRSDAVLAQHQRDLAAFGSGHGSIAMLGNVGAWIKADLDHRDRLAEPHVSAMYGMVDRRIRRWGLTALVLIASGLLLIGGSFAVG